MAETNRHYNSVATLRNVVAMVQLVERVNSRAATLPGMAVFYGPSGYGKSTAAVFAANTFNAYQVQAKSTWTKKSLCEAIMFELGLEPGGRVDRKRHGDYAIALALAHFASRMRWVEYGYRPVPAATEGGRDPTAMFETQSRAWWSQPLGARLRGRI